MEIISLFYYIELQIHYKKALWLTPLQASLVSGVGFALLIKSPCESIELKSNRETKTSWITATKDALCSR